MNVSGERIFSAPRATVWRVLNDPASMAQTNSVAMGVCIGPASRRSAYQTFSYGSAFLPAG